MSDATGASGEPRIVTGSGDGAPSGDSAPLDAAAAVVGDRWMLLIVDALRSGPLRFADLASRLPRVAPNVLTRRLRDLQTAGLVVAEPYSTRPPRHRYTLTPLGHALSPVLAALGRWGEQLVETREATTDRPDLDDEEIRYA
jgi:DNA-binding HxlR family transcriptional regulator